MIIADREPPKDRPTHSVEPGGEQGRRPERHEVEPPEERTDDEGGGDDPKTTQRQE